MVDNNLQNILAIALAKNPIAMSQAMRLNSVGGSLDYVAGRIPVVDLRNHYNQTQIFVTEDSQTELAALQVLKT